MSRFVESLRAWSQFVSAGYVAPAAGTAMVHAAFELERLAAENARLRAALADVLDLCMSVPPGGFANGVTDATGMIDEGECRASDCLDRARAALGGKQ